MATLVPDFGCEAWLPGEHEVNRRAGLAHSVTNAYVVMAALIGMHPGGLLAWTGNLLLPFTTHAVYDFAFLVWLVRKGPDEKCD